MTDSRRALGDHGEHAAAVFLKQNGYEILKKNFRSRSCELDIIAMKQGVICFIEVKTRLNNAWLSAAESITQAKRLKMTRCAEMFLAGYAGEYDQCRFDAVIILPAAEKIARTSDQADAVQTTGMNIEHIENIFEKDGTMNKDVKIGHPRNKKIALLKQKINDPNYINHAINRIASELTVFLCK